MTEPRITSFLLAIKAGADTPKAIAKRHTMSLSNVYRIAQAATRLGFVEMDGGHYTVTGKGWSQIATNGENQ